MVPVDPVAPPVVPEVVASEVEPVEVASPAHWTLLEVLRYDAGLTGSKQGCDKGDCGACTVLVDGEPILACCALAIDQQGKSITTIEQISADRIGAAVQAAWVEHDVPQCGYCQSGQVMSAVALLRRNASPTDADIDTAMAGNICRCGTYARIRAAIRLAADNLA